MTGANIAFIIFPMVIWSPIFPTLFHRSNEYMRIISGLAAIMHRKNPILIIRTIVSASRGKINPAATAVLIINSPTPFPTDPLAFDVSVRFAKSSIEV